MSRGRGETGPPRLLCVDKPAGPTSFDVVRAVRRSTGRRRVGHAGTLDPFASGLLVVGLGAATRLLTHLGEEPKRYRAVVRFGEGREGHDPTGEITATEEVEFTAQALRLVCREFVGEIEQVPPRLSAVKVDGRRSYARFRGGETDLALAPRRVRIHRLRVESVELPEATLDLLCGGGTYVRALARDLGRRLGCPAHLRSLRRTEIGPFGLQLAAPWDEIQQRDGAERAFLPPEAMVRGWARLALTPEQAFAVRRGVQPESSWWDRKSLPGEEGERIALCGECGKLVAVARMQDGRPRLVTVLPEWP